MVGGPRHGSVRARRTLVAGCRFRARLARSAALAPTQGVLIAARGFQGLSGAVMAAGSLAAITSVFPAGPARHRAIGLWAAMNGAGGAAGVLLGGVITTDRLALDPADQPPIGIAQPRRRPSRRDRPARRGREPERFDFAGALTLTGGLIALVYGIVAAGYLGWTGRLLAPVVLGLAAARRLPRHRARAAPRPSCRCAR